MSPAIWWDDSLLLRTEEERAGEWDDLAAKVFLAVGSEEERADIPMLAQFKMVSNLETLATRLGAREYPSLDVSRYIAEGESHTSVVPVGLTRGLRSVFRPPRPG